MRISAKLSQRGREFGPKCAKPFGYSSPTVEHRIDRHFEGSEDPLVGF
jgi:hypothetical protein